MSTASSELFERILFTYPLLKRIVSELEPGDFRNLLLSGQVLPMSRSEANKFLISLQCFFCQRSNAARMVFPCVGIFDEPVTLDLEKIESYWYQLTTAYNDKCKFNKRFLRLGDVREHRPACCQFCIPRFLLVNQMHWERASGQLLDMRYHMCKNHCLENFHPPLALPKGKCRCEALLLDQGWRCYLCDVDVWLQLKTRGKNFKSALRYRQTVTTFATQEPTCEYKADEPSLEETCCMMDCKGSVWEDVENAAFLVFCARCSTVYKEKDMDAVRGLRSEPTSVD